MTRKHEQVEKVEILLKEHKMALIEELGNIAFDQLTPGETAKIVGLETKRFPDLLRENWLEPVPNRKAGRANFYYRWRAEFVRRYRKTKPKETP